MASIGGIEAWEGVARAVHDHTGIEAPVSAFVLAEAFDLRVVPVFGSGSLRGDRILYDATVRPVRQHGIVAHEVAHFALRYHGEDDAEQAARYTAGALMLPWRCFDRQLRSTAWNLDELRALNPNASAEMIARRIVELRDACVTVFDNGREQSRVVSPWLPRGYKRTSEFERDMAGACLESGESQRDDLCCAFPVFDGSYRRVIVVCEARQLSLRI